MTRTKAASVVERALPHNLEAERSVLGAILVNNQALFQVATELHPEHFFRDAHRRVYKALQHLLSRRDDGADLVTLFEELKRTGDLDAVGGPAYVSSLVDGVPRATNIRHYAAIVKEKATLRAMISTAERIVLEAYDAEASSSEILATADRDIVQLRHGAGNNRMRSLNETAQAFCDDLAFRADHQGQLTGVPTGFKSIDEMTNGWQAGDLIVIAARPSIGKTIFTMNTARACAGTLRADGTPRRVGVFSLEMRRVQLQYRLLASESQVDLSRLLSGYLTEDEWRRATEAMGVLNQLPILIDDTAARTRWDVRGECRRLLADGGLDLVVIDYVQLMAGSLEGREAGNRNAELTDISRGLKIMADELSCPVIIVSQLNRAGESRADPRPKLSDLRETGALEQDADIVCFLHRKHHKEDGTTQFIVEKQRNGPTGTLNLTVNRPVVTFTDGGDDLPPDTPEEKQAKKVDFFKQRARRH